ncbi:MAG: hypothetical protein HZA48_03415 [Planctomycetes bacterium]|nr:hypothetical protein [Planctomycetota bacterium]
MRKRGYFNFQQAELLCKALNSQKADYLLIGKSGAVIMGYPGTTQDVDIYPKKDPENAKKIIKALNSIGFKLDNKIKEAILRGKDFVQIKSGPFDIDLVFAPDGFENYDEVKKRSVKIKYFPVANISDIIRSKQAAGRERDMIELPLLKAFAKSLEREGLKWH